MSRPSFENEDILISNGFRRIAGVDEAGRGCIAGPIVAASCILPEDRTLPWLSEINDSKQLTEQKREELYPLIIENCEYAVAVIEASEIDERGISACGKDVLQNALMGINPPPGAALVDFFKLPFLPIPQMNLTHGDAVSLSIAAASIIAKVTRDHLMVELDKEYPYYGFAKNKGYGTEEHETAIKKYGICSKHRKTFCTKIL